MKTRIAINSSYISCIESLDEFPDEMVTGVVNDYQLAVKNNYLETRPKYREKQKQIIKVYDDIQVVSDRWIKELNTEDFEMLLDLRKQYDELWKKIYEFNTTYREQEKKNRDTTPDVSIKQNKEYYGFYIDTKNQTIVEMSPIKYLEYVAYDIYDITLFENVFELDAQNIYQYALDMRNGSLFQPPWLDLKNKAQEGRNRVIAAFVNGYEKIPVVLK